jgi:hypothetical protein
MITEIALNQPTATLIAGIAAALGSTTVAVIAVILTWRNTRATLTQQRTMADDERIWQDQRATYLKIAKWAASHHLPDETFLEVEEIEELSAWTADPGETLTAKARLFAVNEPVINALTDLHAYWTTERLILETAEFLQGHEKLNNGKFDDQQLAKMYGWKDLADARKSLHKPREAWAKARDRLENALSEIYRLPNSN